MRRCPGKREAGSREVGVRKELCLGWPWALQLLNMTADKMFLMVTVETGHVRAPHISGCWHCHCLRHGYRSGASQGPEIGQLSWLHRTAGVLCYVVCAGLQLGRLRQMEPELKARLGYVEGLCRQTKYLLMKTEL